VLGRVERELLRRRRIEYECSSSSLEGLEISCRVISRYIRRRLLWFLPILLGFLLFQGSNFLSVSSESTPLAGPFLYLIYSFLFFLLYYLRGVGYQILASILRVGRYQRRAIGEKWKDGLLAFADCLSFSGKTCLILCSWFCLIGDFLGTELVDWMACLLRC
jgi:hypothetical protein